MSDTETIGENGLDRLQGKVALITGGGSGIGEASAKLFVNEGAQVAIADLNLESAERVAGDINDTGGNASAIQLNVTDNDSCAEAVDATVDQFGRVDVLVNSAGVGSFRSIDMDYEERWQSVIDVNLKGTVLMTRQAVEQMKEQGSGSVVNLASIRGLVGYPSFITDGFNPYPHSKGGVVNATRRHGYRTGEIEHSRECRVPRIHKHRNDASDPRKHRDVRSHRSVASDWTVRGADRNCSRGSVLSVGRGFVRDGCVPRDRRRVYRAVTSAQEHASGIFEGATGCGQAVAVDNSLAIALPFPSEAMLGLPFTSNTSSALAIIHGSAS